MMKTIATVVLSGLIAACATQPRVPAPAAAANPKPPAPASTMAATSPVGTTTVAAAPAADVVNQSYLKRGYRAVHRNGQLLYCQSQVLTGTHFQHTVCLSDAQLKAADDGKQSTLDQMGKGGALDCLKQCN